MRDRRKQTLNYDTNVKMFQSFQNTTAVSLLYICLCFFHILFYLKGKQTSNCELFHIIQQLLFFLTVTRRVFIQKTILQNRCCTVLSYFCCILTLEWKKKKLITVRSFKTSGSSFKPHCNKSHDFSLFLPGYS